MPEPVWLCRECLGLRMNCPIAMRHAQVGLILGDYMQSRPRVTVQLKASYRRVDVIAEGLDLASYPSQDLCPAREEYCGN